MKNIRGKKILLLTAIVLSALWATTPAASAQTFKVLYSFPNTASAPESNTPTSLTQGREGNLYGPLSDLYTLTAGEIYRITASGEFTVVLDLGGDTDGANPVAPVLLGRDASFYGTAENGGANNVGTIFEMTLGQLPTTLFVFDGLDGAYPSSQLIQTLNGDFYGTTAGGGANCEVPPTWGCGTVFRMTPIGELTTLYSFCAATDCYDGSFPNGIVQADNGNFYGTTFSGGTTNCAEGPSFCGTVFEITPHGKLTTLYNFCALPHCADGFNVTSGLVLGNDGNLYGIAGEGGKILSAGTIFKITPAGKLTTLYNFCSQPNCLDGGGPLGLMLASDGNFYGTTGSGGTSSYCNDINPFGTGCGTIFRFTPDGQFTILYNFCSQEYCADGDGGVLSQATNGTFYGTTAAGGDQQAGTIFSFSTGLRPFLETVPTVGEAGGNVTILGNDLAGATSVTFNGTPATFQLLSPTAIEATVPSGATTGKVEVTTPSRTLLSNVAFRVP